MDPTGCVVKAELSVKHEMDPTAFVMKAGTVS
jgi:hypothetical protein